MLRRLIQGLTLCACVLAAGCGASTTKTGLTAGFAELAKDAHSYMKSDLIPGVGTARFPDMLAVSRAKVKIAQSKVAGEEDGGVWLILTMINVKTSELHSMQEMANLAPQSSRTARRAAEELENEREHCMSEADGWINGGLLLRVLNAGPCLAQAKSALAMLKQK